MYASARKIPHLRVILLFALGIGSPLQGAQRSDTTKAYRAARDAEVDYEFSARHNAALRGMGRGRSGSCDETVGRFCLIYDTGREPLPPEPERVLQQRLRALEKLRAAWAFDHSREKTVFPLVRLLLENKDAEEASTVTQEFARAAGDSKTAHMLNALTANARGDIPTAEETIARWLAAEDSAGRRRLQDLTWLLHRKERESYRNLTPEERAAFEARFWRYADALYLTPGNETRAEHFARHAENELLQRVPMVRGASSWGDDVAQINIRFGSPKARSREWPGASIGSQISITEHFHPEQRIFAAPQLDSVLRVRARPGIGWPMDTVRSISGHAPSTFRRMLPLEHQATVFQRDGQYWLRVDGMVVADTSAAAGASAARALVVLDQELNELARLQDTTLLRGDTMFFGLELALPPNAAFYSAEMLEKETRLAARARYPLEKPAAPGGLFISDVLLTEAYPAGELPAGREDPLIRAQPDAILSPEPFGIFADVDLGRPGPDSITVFFELTNLDGSPAIVRAFRWIGETLGLADRQAPTRMSWNAEVNENGRATIAMTVDPGGLGDGRYFIELAVADRAGRRALVRRELVLRQRRGE